MTGPGIQGNYPFTDQPLVRKKAFGETAGFSPEMQLKAEIMGAQSDDQLDAVARRVDLFVRSR